jgi:hypothetical protein
MVRVTPISHDGERAVAVIATSHGSAVVTLDLALAEAIPLLAEMPSGAIYRSTLAGDVDPSDVFGATVMFVLDCFDREQQASQPRPPADEGHLGPAQAGRVSGSTSAHTASPWRRKSATIGAGAQSVIARS